MKANELMDAIGEVRDEFIENAWPAGKSEAGKINKWTRRIAAAAACAAVVGGCLIMLPGQMPDEAEGAPAQGYSSGHQEGSVFMSYAGPVFPLTLMEESGHIYAERNICYDFSAYSGEAANADASDVQGVAVQDRYVLSNLSDSDAEVTGVYPIAGSFQSMDWPVITVNGEQAEWRLDAGGYTGGFSGAGDEHSTSLNLQNITDWTGYKALLAEGSYFENAFTQPEELSRPVVVYRLSELSDGAGEYEAAYLCMSFKYNPEKTSIMTWGFNGGGVREDTGEECRGFFIREGLRKADEDVKYFIAVGEDIESYTLQGYLNGACQAGEEIADAGATVIREEMTLGELLREITSIRYNAIAENEFDGDSNRYINGYITYEMYYNAVVRHFAAYGEQGTDPKERYSLGMLDDIINETAYHNRILYLSFDITIPANGTVELSIAQHKAASFDFDCSDSENAGIEGYDMVTVLGSNIAFRGQSASIINYEGIEIVRQNFGFDPENEITQVTLEPEQPHYYMEIRKKETD